MIGSGSGDASDDGTANRHEDRFRICEAERALAGAKQSDDQAYLEGQMSLQVASGK